MALKFNTQKARYGFFWGLVLLTIGQGLYFSRDWSIGEGLKNLIMHHNLTDTGGFYVGGLSGVFINASLALGVMLVFFGLTKTKIGSNEFPALLLTYAYSFYGKNFLNIIPLALGVYLYAYVHKEKLSSRSPFACYAGAFAPIVSTLAFHTPALNTYGLETSFFVAIAIGIISGYMIAYVATWMPIILRGRSILLGAACVGVVAIVVTNVLRAFGFVWNEYVNPPYISQNYSKEIFISYFIVLVYFVIIGLLGEHSNIGAFIRQQRGIDKSNQLVEDCGFCQTVLSTGLYGMILYLYMISVPTVEAHGELWAGLFTGAAFVAKGLTLKNAIPFFIGMIGFNFTSAGFVGSMYGGSFIESGLQKIGSRATMMGTYVGSNIAPLNEILGFRSGVIMGILYGAIVPQISSLYHQTVLYNSGFAIAITVILFHAGEKN